MHRWLSVLSSRRQLCAAQMLVTTICCVHAACADCCGARNEQDRCTNLLEAVVAAKALQPLHQGARERDVWCVILSQHVTTCQSGKAPLYGARVPHGCTLLHFYCTLFGCRQQCRRWCWPCKCWPMQRPTGVCCQWGSARLNAPGSNGAGGLLPPWAAWTRLPAAHRRIAVGCRMQVLRSRD